jgi:copper chaperone CopZ
LSSLLGSHRYSIAEPNSFHKHHPRHPAALAFIWRLKMQLATPLLAVAAVLGTSFVFADDPLPVTKSKLLVTGLHCPPCTKTVQQSLQKVKGVNSVTVDWNTKNAMVEFDEAVLSVQALTQKIAATPHMMGGDMKYDAWLALKVPALKDEATGKKVKAALAELKGIKQVAVYPDKQAIGVQFSGDGKLTTQEVIGQLAKAGVEAKGY